MYLRYRFDPWQSCRCEACDVGCGVGSHNIVGNAGTIEGVRLAGFLCFVIWMVSLLIMTW